jgi:hypothetical protein
MIDELASKVMGWVIHPNNTSHWVKDPIAPDYRVEAIVGNWNPLANPAHARQILAVLEQTHHVELKTPFQPGSPYLAGATPHGCSGWNGVPDIQVAAATLEQAVCLLSLQVTALPAHGLLVLEEPLEAEDGDS